MDFSRQGEVQYRRPQAECERMKIMNEMNMNDIAVSPSHLSLYLCFRVQSYIGNLTGYCKEWPVFTV